MEGQTAPGEVVARPRPPRFAFLILIVCWYPHVKTLLALAARAQVLLMYKEVTEVPLPLEIVLSVSDGLREWWFPVLMGFVIAAGVLSVFTLKGRLDRHLKRLILIDLTLSAGLMLAWGVTLLPVFRSDPGAVLK